jgi:O-antigen ligase
MNDRYYRLLLPVVLFGCGLLVTGIAIFQPGYLSSDYSLGVLIFLQVMLAALWKYRQRFFPLLLVVFLWAGTTMPWSSAWTAGRWLVLTVGALAGFALYMRDGRHRFGIFHLVAFFCVLAALVSAMVSLFPTLAFLKALSLLLLFLYGAAGARLAMLGREESFFRYLLSAMEILVYVTAVAYFLLRIPVYGNPNSLGAVMGVAAAPLLFWEILTREDTSGRRRKIFAFMVCLVLLFFSQARAGILAAAASCLAVCIASSRYKLLIQGSAAATAMAILALLLTPSQLDQDMPSRHEDSSLASFFLYKGKEEAGLLGSRTTSWDETVSVIQDHPWFGIGFGTRLTSTAEDWQIGRFSSSSVTTREHGDSYLAIAEGVGLLGAVPFYFLVSLLALYVGRTLNGLRRTGNCHQLVIPVALVLIAGLIHAAFEDWLFAAGYYLCVFFWVFAFAFIDLLPARAQARPRSFGNIGFTTLRQAMPLVMPEP